MPWIRRGAGFVTAPPGEGQRTAQTKIKGRNDMANVTIDSEVREGVALLTLDNPPLNLVTRDMTRMLDEGLDRLAADPDVRVLVVTGSGRRAFCAGSDIKEFPAYIEAGNVVDKKLRYENQTYSKLDDFPKPTVAAVNGLAYGGGLELAVCCDLIVAEEDTPLCLPEVWLGVFPGSGGSIRVTRRIGEGRAKEIMFLGDPIDARTALAWGLVNRVVAAGKAVESAIALAGEIASRPNRALQVCKRAVDLAFDMPEDEAVERSLALSREAFATDDCREGVRAFFAKEKPRFTHS
jgi:enoyl-CoA hydratase/carnithine racemase